MLGISIYLEKQNKEEVKNYIKLAHKYGFKRIFSNLLGVDRDIKEIKKDFKEILTFAKKLGMEVILDIAPSIFEKLKISYDDLSFFKNIGATGIRLDEGFNGLKEASLTYNKHDLNVEINMSNGTKYLDNIMSFQPNKKKLLGCHNFYPMEYSGLSLDQFIKTSKQFKDYGIRSAAFVNSNVAKIGPWKVMDGLCTLEMHRFLPITTQVKHLMLIDLIDDIIIGNAFASEEELKSISEIKPVVNLDIIFSKNVTDLEKKIVLKEKHFNRGDVSDYLVRSTMSRVKYSNETFSIHDTEDFLIKGNIIIGNDNFGQYKGEMQLIKKEHPNTKKRKNLVAKVVDHEIFLIDFIKPWNKFSFSEYKKK